MYALVSTGRLVHNICMYVGWVHSVKFVAISVIVLYSMYTGVHSS